MDPGSAYYDDVGGGFAPSEVIIKCRSRIHDQMAVAVDCALRLRTFAQKVLNLRAKSKFLMHILPFSLEKVIPFEKPQKNDP